MELLKSIKNSSFIIKRFVANSILALRDAGTKAKLTFSLLIMTIVGGAVDPVIMGYIADTTGSMAIAFLIPLVCYGVIGTYALLNRHVPLLPKGAFQKNSLNGLCTPFGSPVSGGQKPSLPLRKAPPFSSILSSLRDERM